MTPLPIGYRILACIVALGSILAASSFAQTMTNSSTEEQALASVSMKSTPDSTALTDVSKVAPVQITGSDSKKVVHLVGYDFPSSQDRRKAFLTDFIGLGAFIDPAFQATFDEFHSLKEAYPQDGYSGSGAHPGHGEVPEWSEGFDGYSKRYASRFGMGLLGTAGRYGIGELLRQDVSYHPCQCRSAFPRAYHAVTQSLVALTRSGRAVPSVAALISPYIAAEAAFVAWYPARYNASDALRTSTRSTLGFRSRTSSTNSNGVRSG